MALQHPVPEISAITNTQTDTHTHARNTAINIIHYVVEVSIHTIILFCVESAKMLMIYINGRRLYTQAFISTRCCMRNLPLMKACAPKCLPFTRVHKSSTFRGFLHKGELSCERSPRPHNQLLALVASGAKTSQAFWIDVTGTPLELLINGISSIEAEIRVF